MAYIHLSLGSRRIPKNKMKLKTANGHIVSIILRRLGLAKLYLLNFIALH